jgi:hypothetical protein
VLIPSRRFRHEPPTVAIPKRPCLCLVRLASDLTVRPMTACTAGRTLALEFPPRFVLRVRGQAVQGHDLLRNG